MTGLVAAEARKLWTVRTTWILTLVGAALITLTAAVNLFATDLAGPFEGTAEQVATVVDQIGGNAIIVLVVALLSMTTEFRHGTVGRTFQITPSRSRVLVAKLLVGALYALVFFAVGLVVVGVLLVLRLLTADVDLTFGAPVLEALWQGPVGLGLNALLGVALGALMRSQVIAITVTLVWFFIVENIVVALLPDVGRWLPSQLVTAVFVPPEQAMPGMAYLSPGLALVTFLGYVLVAAAMAVTLLRMRDV